LGEERTEMGKGECTALRENEGEEGENDLKRGHVRVLNRVCSIATRCVRSHEGAFVRTRAESCTVCGARTHTASVCAMWASALEHT
jgi:hypothetical protein